MEGRRRLRPRRRRQARNPAGFMAAARHSHPPLDGFPQTPHQVAVRCRPTLRCPIQCAPLARRTWTDSTGSRAVVAGVGVRRPSSPSRCRPISSTNASTAWGRTTSRRIASPNRGASTTGVNAIAGGTAPSLPWPQRCLGNVVAPRPGRPVHVALRLGSCLSLDDGRPIRMTWISHGLPTRAAQRPCPTAILCLLRSRPCRRSPLAIRMTRSSPSRPPQAAHRLCPNVAPRLLYSLLRQREGPSSLVAPCRD